MCQVVYFCWEATLCRSRKYPYYPYGRFLFCTQPSPQEIPVQLQCNNTIQYTLFNEGEHINLLQFANIWPSKINSNRQEKNNTLLVKFWLLQSTYVIREQWLHI